MTCVDLVGGAAIGYPATWRSNLRRQSLHVNDWRLIADSCMSIPCSLTIIQYDYDRGLVVHAWNREADGFPAWGSTVSGCAVGRRRRFVWWAGLLPQHSLSDSLESIRINNQNTRMHDCEQSQFPFGGWCLQPICNRGRICNSVHGELFWPVPL